MNIILAIPDMQGASARSNLNKPVRRAWDKVSRCGAIKTTYYLRTMQASNVEKSTIDVQEVQRGVMATQTAATAAAAAAANAKRKFTAEEKMVCSIDAMMNGGECEACQ